MKPKKILKIAKERGLDGVVICDHNTIKGGLEAQKLNTDKDFLVIVGAEIATNAGDVTGIFLTKEIESRNFDDVVAEIRAQNGLVILNHPYKGHDLTKIDLKKVDFIEGYNSRLNLIDNQKAVQLALDNNILMTAGSDAHCYSEIGNSITVVKDLKTLFPIEHHYKKSNQIFVTCSQYIKAYKRRNYKVFISATKIYIKYILKSFFGIFK